MSSTLVISPPLPDAPYRGIEPFRFIDQLLFAARDDETWELLSKVTLYRAMLLYGESGAGKSSLINAGLLPEALNDNYIPHRLRIQPFKDREIRVERIIREDGTDPIYLPSTFHPTSSPNKETGPDAASFELSLEAFVQQLSESCRRPNDTGAAEVGGLIYEPAASRPLLIFDQFEEFITLFELGPRSSQSQSSRDELSELQAKILDVLVMLIRDTNLPLKIVFVFREDFLAKLNLLLDHCPELVDQALRLVPPHVSALPKIIRQPFVDPELRAHFKNVIKDINESGSELSEQLAHEIAADLSKLSNNNLINLSELQIVCLLLWRSKDPETLYREKGAEGLLEDYLASVVGRLPPEWQDTAVILLAEMLTSSNTRNIVSEADLKATGESERINEHQVDAVLNALCRSQVVRSERHRELFFYELGSEYLVSWINQRATQRRVDLMMVDAIEERRRGIELQQFSRKILFLQALVILIGAIALVVIGYLIQKSANAEKEKAIADQQAVESEYRRLMAVGQTHLAEQQRDRLQSTIKPLLGSNDAAKLEAITKIREWRKEGNLPSEFLLLLLAAQEKSENVEVKNAAKEAVVEAAQVDPEFSKSIDLAALSNPNLAAKLPLRFSIYLADESQRATAERISNSLRKEGYVVASNPSIATKPPKWDSELRYFTPPESRQKQPTDLINLLISVSRTNWTASYTPRYSKSARGNSGQMELWFAVPAGHLELGFVDDADKPITGVKPSLVQFELKNGPGISFKSKNMNITVPQGNYEVTISVPGYKPLQQALSITGTETIEWKSLKLTRE